MASKRDLATARSRAAAALVELRSEEKRAGMAPTRNDMNSQERAAMVRALVEYRSTLTHRTRELRYMREQKEAETCNTPH